MKLHRFTQRRAIQIDENVVGFLRLPAGVAIGAIPVVQFHEPSRHWTTRRLAFFTLGWLLVVRGTMCRCAPSTSQPSSTEIGQELQI